MPHPDELEVDRKEPSNQVEVALKMLIEAMHSEFDWFNEEELKNTPSRIYRFYQEMKATSEFKFTQFDDTKTDQLVILRDIDFSSLCSHHMLPFKGKAHVGYLPNGKICGISKLARVVVHYASKPQTQEALTQEVADFLFTKLKARFVMVVFTGHHECMSMRGTKQADSDMVTSAMRHEGAMEDANWMSLKEEFLTLIKI